MVNLGGQRAKSAKSRTEAFELTPDVPEVDDHGDYHQRELRFIAAFRLRDAANRIATLVGMTRATQLRVELLAIYDRLMVEERELLVRSMEPSLFKGPAAAASKAAKRMA